jgi:rhamnosyltransferase
MIVAIIILYNPDISVLDKSIKSINESVYHILLIDNSPQNNIFIYNNTTNEKDKISYYYNGNRGGIAGAQNIGIIEALKKGAEFILILDQDSIPKQNMVNILYKAYLELSKNAKVACVGTSLVDIEYSQQIFQKVSEIKSSGSFFHKNTFYEIGLMEEDLFIDAVDSEWCWRALSKGYALYIISNALMEHKLGEGDKNLFGIKISIPASFRTYYQIRNYMFMLKRNYVPLYWKLSNGFKYLIKFFAYPVLLKDINYTKYMIKGLYHGIINKKGGIT